MGSLHWAFPLSRRDFLIFLLVFFAYLAVAELGLYVFFNFHTSPALIWPPVGLSLAFALLFGYRIWLPAFVAQFLAVVLQLGWSAYDISLVNAVAYTFQTLVALYVLRRLGFRTEMDTAHSAQLLVAVAFIVTAIEPTISTMYQYLHHTLSISAIEYFVRSWAGGVFSVLVFTPFLTTWLSEKKFSYTRGEKFELAGALTTLIGSVYFIFWSAYLMPLGIVIIFVVPAVLAWFALNMRPHWMSLSIVIFALGGIAGSIIASPTPTPLSLQLMSDEIYIGFIAAFFVIFVAVVEERRNAYAVLKTNNDRLDEALIRISAEDKAKTEFIAMLGHELRNPLAPIVSAHEWLHLQPQTTSSLEALESAQENTRMIQRLLDDLLDTARISQQKLKLQKETVRLQDLVTKSIESIANFLQSRHHKLRLSIPVEDVWVHGDSVRLRQVIINLLNNAGKYTEPGGQIELSCDVSGEELTISVHDSGKGIALDKLESIFEPFNQIRDESGVNMGLGIGLSLSKRLVELHDGTIHAESNGLGHGSRFIVKLPIPDQKTITHLREPKAKPIDVTKTNMLVVDDNIHAAKGLSKLLAHHGHQVVVAHSGEEALKKIEEYDPKVVFLDIGLPDINGYEVAKRLRERNWGGLLIALTGYGQASDQKRALDAGCDAHLIKPISIDDISALLSTAVSSAEAH